MCNLVEKFMNGCYEPGDFKSYFNENMQALNLPVPDTLFDNFNAAIANAGLLLEALNTLGKGATMKEIVIATSGLEKLKVAAAIGASFYIGAVIGSLAVASGRSLSCGSRIADMFVFLYTNDLIFDDWQKFYRANPEILDPVNIRRPAYALKALA